MTRLWKTGSAILSALTLASVTAAAQTVAFEETWDGASGPFPQVVNPTGGAVGGSTSFTADNVWTGNVDVTESPGVGPHLAISLIDESGDVKLQWNADAADGADNDVAFSTAIGTPFTLDSVESITFTADITVGQTGVNGGRDSTFYFGSDAFTYFAVQLVTRDEVGGEVIEVEWANGVDDNDANFGDGNVIIGGGEIVAGGRYIMTCIVEPSIGGTDFTVSLVDTSDSSVVVSGTTTAPAGEAPALSTLVNTFIIEGKRRMYHTWNDVTLEVVTAGGAVLVPGGGFEGPGAPASGVLGLVLLVGFALVAGVAFARRQAAA